MNDFKAARLNKKFSQAYVANQLGLTDKSTISKWETTNSNPRIEMLPQIAALYGCTIDELLSWLQEKNKPLSRSKVK